MRQTLAAITIFLVSASTSPQAGTRADTKLQQLKGCLDTNLAQFLPSGDSAEVLSKAALGICGDIIDDVVEIAIAEIRQEHQDEFTKADAEYGRAYLTKKINGLVYTYTVKFKAVGGPTTLNFPKDED